MTDLARFCSKNGRTDKVMQWDGKRVATNGHVAIIIPGPCHAEDQPIVEFVEESLKKHMALHPAKWLEFPNLPKCEDCNGTGLIVDTCNSCKGDGKCICTCCEDTHDCGICDGTGQVECDCDLCVRVIIPGGFVRGEDVALLQSLTGVKYGKVADKDGHVIMRFQCGEGEGIFLVYKSKKQS